MIAVLVIPIILIWKIRAKWGQKIALSLTLCLTMVMIVITIVRMVGLQIGEIVDYIWESYFMAIAAGTGLPLVALSAFRSLYVSKAQHRNVHSPITTCNWYKNGGDAPVQITGKVTGNTESQMNSAETTTKGKFLVNIDILLATTTGDRSYIDGNGRTSLGTEACD